MEFVELMNPSFNHAQIEIEFQRLWSHCKSRLCDQTMLSFDLVIKWSADPSILVAFVSCRRSLVDTLKPRWARCVLS